MMSSGCLTPPRIEAVALAFTVNWETLKSRANRVDTVACWVTCTALQPM